MPHVDAPHSICDFGLARADITPPPGVYHRMWGAAKHDRATGVHQPLSATAMAFAPRGERDPARRQVLLALDLCLLWGPEMNSLLDALASAAGLAREQFEVVFSHTHAAGLMDRNRASFPGGDLIGPYLDRLSETCAELVQSALADARPATIVHGVGRCGLAAERDFWDAERKETVCGFNPSGVCDDRVRVARITDAAGNLRATLVHYACHPTTLAFDNTLVSPDFPGTLRQVVERETAAPCVFLQGASGDVGPREGFVGDPAVAERNGRQLAYAALEAITGLPPPGTRYEYQGAVVSGATLGIWAHRPLPADRVAAAECFQVERETLPLDYRSGLPSLAEVDADRSRWLEVETSARAAGDLPRAADARAMAERALRQRNRLSVLPPGERFPYELRLWRLGDAVWVFLEGELYNVAQTALSAAFPEMALSVLTLANGTRVSYIPPADLYGRGVYQESIALLAPGSLEKIIAAVRDRLGGCVPARS